ncbi:MAG: YbaB/EbfC family nucleoid-associated protein [Spirochaetales bacterium]|nr:YbaB/EbfC family nucleoid-associated protein [Spirochaetales bacterium]
MNPFDLLKNMNSLRSQMAQMQGKLETLSATGSSGGAMVEVTINGKMEVQSIKIEESVVDPNDVKTLEVLVAAAFNNAVAAMQELLKEEATSLATGGSK